MLVVCDDSAWGLRFAAGTRVVGGCFEEHLIDREGALGGAGGRSGAVVGIRVPRGSECGLERQVGRGEMGAMVDIDVEGTATGLGVMSDRVQEQTQDVPCRSRVRCESVLRGAGRTMADRRIPRDCPSAV